MRKEMRKQIFRRVRYYSKWVGLAFVLAGVLLFILQFVPTYTGRGLLFWVFVISGIIWGLDTLWSTLKDLGEIADEIRDNEHPKAN